MNEKLLRKVVDNDPREKRNKSPREIHFEWREQRLVGVFLKWTALIAMGVFLYWYVFERAATLTLARRIPLKARWSLGFSIGSFFLWLVYSLFGCRCPRCDRSLPFDWSLGGWLIGVKEPRADCLNCKARLE